MEKERCNVDARFPGEFSRDTALRPNFEGMELTSIAYIEQKWKRYEEMDTQLSSTFTTGCRCLPKALPKAASLDGLEDDRRMFSCLFRLVGGPAGPAGRGSPPRRARTVPGHPDDLSPGKVDYLMSHGFCGPTYYCHCSSFEEWLEENLDMLRTIHLASQDCLDCSKEWQGWHCNTC